MSTLDIPNAYPVSQGKKYSIGSLSYPSDLMGNDIYGGNYILIQINETVASKIINEQQDKTLDQVSNTDRGQMVADSKKLQQQPGGAIGVFGGLGAVVGAVGGGLLGGNFMGALKGAAVGGVLGGGSAAVVASTAGSLTRPTKRIQSAIALHMPNQLNVRYSTSYDTEDTIDFAMIAAAGGAGSEIVKALQSGKSIPETAEQQAPTAGAAAGNIALRKLPNSGALSKLSGLAPNPRKEQIFKGVDFRTFTFEYQFFPRNSDESANVLEIINLFRTHMHPEFKDANSFLYVYPSEFDIQYYSGNRENTKLHKHTSCVLTEMAVNYTPNGQFTAFADGTPTHINLQLTFKELALLDKKKMQDKIAY